MWSAAALVFLSLLCSTSYCYITQPNCTAKNKIACYVCIGESSSDSDCDSEETVCCSGACFKVVDKERQVVLKGCTPDKEEDGSMKIRSYDVRVRRNEKVRGQSYFCTEKDYCNNVRLPTLHLGVLLTCIFFYGYRLRLSFTFETI